MAPRQLPHVALPASARAAVQLNQMAVRGARAAARAPHGPRMRPYDPIIAVLAHSLPPLDGSAEPLRVALNALAELAPARGVRPQPVSAAGVPAVWIEPATARASAGALGIPAAPAPRTILYLHGGGYVCGSTRTHLRLMANLADAAHARIFAPDYRLAPEHPYPAAVEDSWSVYWWLLCQGIDPATLIVAGDSAGGGLTVALLLALRDAGLPLPAAGILLSPWLDLACHGASLRANATRDYLNEIWIRAVIAMYLKDADPCTPLASPLYADLHGLPPLLIQASTSEMLLDDATRFAQRAFAAGVTVDLELWENMVHVWQALDVFEPSAGQAIASAGRFARRRVPDPATREVHGPAH